MQTTVNKKIKNSFLLLKDYCEKENYKGWDPFDGLSSKIFSLTPFSNNRFLRLAWIQFFKRNPINLRSLFLIDKGYNPKGISLFLTGYCNLYKITKRGDTYFGDQSQIIKQIHYLAELLINLQTKGYSGSCWGYNFDWQNRSFFQPKYTPTVVVTSFCADSLFNAYETTGVKKYLEIALQSAYFIINDLNRTPNGNNFLFSYSPIDNSQVYNASFLGARLLARCFHYTNILNYKILANKVIESCLQNQNTNGSWLYGASANQNWIDSFHTGFNLECLWEYMLYTNNYEANPSFIKGMNYYIESFWGQDGIPKYYNNKTYPIDIHSPAELLVVLSKTRLLNKQKLLVNKVLQFTITNMQSPQGFFYYQIKRYFKSKISYMRWAQAWIFNSFSWYINSKTQP